MTTSMVQPVNLDVLKVKKEYVPTLFVNREPELQTIANSVRQAQAGNTITEPIVNFWGGVGIGKTWILRRLEHEYAYSIARPTPGIERPTFALLYQFPEETTSVVLEHTVRNLAAKAIEQLGAALRGEELDQLTLTKANGEPGTLVKVLTALSRRLVPLILLDNTEHVPPNDWERLEQHLIEPLVSTNRILVVVAGRRQIPRWRRFEVRRRVMETQKSRIRPFDKGAVARQLEKYQYPIPADLLFPYTGGNPHLVYGIAHNILDWTKGREEIKLNRAWFHRHDNVLLEILRYAEGEQLESVPRDTPVGNLQDILPAVSALRFYRIEALRYMLAEQKKQVEEQPDGYYLNILRALEQETEVVWWDRERRAYMTSEVARRIMNRRQALESPKEYSTHHQQAIGMYWNWVKEIPPASEDFIVEIWFHLVSSYLPNGTMERLRSEVKKTFDYAHKHLSADRFMILQKQLDERYGDREILDLLPENLRARWFRELERLLDTKVE